MMDLEEKIIERKILLEIFVAAYPKEMSCAEVLVRAKVQLGRAVDERDLNFHLAYLIDASVVSARDLRGVKKQLRLFRATSKGVQVVDGLIEAPLGLGF